MTYSTALASLTLVLFTACSTPPVVVQSVSDWGENPMEDPEYMTALNAYMTPGEAHDEIARRAGNWNIRTKVVMSPETESISMDATSNSKMILGGRFLLEEFHGSMMGEPFEGLLIVGFDNLKNRYFSMWMDTWGTGLSRADGVQDSDGSIQMSGAMTDVLTPNGRPYRHVMRAEGSGFVSELYDTLPDGTEWMVMEMTYTRRPAE